MSLKLNSSGGGSVTLQEPTTASNVTLNLPATDATVLTDSAGVLNIGSGQVYKDSSGNVGIGTSSPSNNGLGKSLQVGQSSALVAETTGNRFWLGSNWYYSGSDRYITNGHATLYSQQSGQHLWFNAASGTAGNSISFTQAMTLDASGNLILASAGNPRIYSPGVFNVTNGAAANMIVTSDGGFARSTSSLKYKKNVNDSVRGLSDLLKLRAITYESKNETEAGIVFGGLIAEEVHEAGLTEFVQYAEDGTPDALAYGNMVSLCIKAIQELKAEVDALRAQVEAQ
jgi:hypothetical protein